ncbi:transcriptional regulator GcvA [Dyella choica]|uniref:Transcriptional regulator GcvA n=1 Tax=Dyella choica TaxID=1927959 RepID=A0A3S0RID2_9GAMM|nr:transcriptional regulator GcvA [Dyella choica]RUL71829.1 transcriptional regulator GcvA [Dyella choica]
MRKPLPPMHTLRTFEALARARNFARAAEELHLTASAVSHQIKALESFYATKLFQRNRRDVALTTAGSKLLEVVGNVLEQLAEVGESLRARDGSRLSITAPPSLASRWLMPRLGAFMATHPHIELKLHATPALQDLDEDECDFGLRYGKGRWAGLHSEKLFDEALFPVASRTYAADKKIRGLSDLKSCLLLRDDFRSWEDWFAQVGHRPDRMTYGPSFSDSALLMQAAEAGQGVALARSALAADAIAAGSLIRIGKLSAPAPGAYYLVSSSRRPDSPSAALFRQWLLDTARRSSGV